MKRISTLLVLAIILGLTGCGGGGGSSSLMPNMQPSNLSNQANTTDKHSVAKQTPSSNTQASDTSVDTPPAPPASDDDDLDMPPPPPSFGD